MYKQIVWALRSGAMIAVPYSIFSYIQPLLTSSLHCWSLCFHSSLQWILLMVFCESFWIPISQTSISFTYPSIKIKVMTMVCMFLHDQDPSHLLISGFCPSVPSLTLFQPQGAIFVFVLVVAIHRLMGPLSLLFPLPWKFFPEASTYFPLTSVRLKCQQVLRL